jgi:16S rRNA (guanine527-N7)-methyltransferase
VKHNRALFLSHFKLTDHQISQFETYEQMLRQWQKTINLVGPKTLDAVWERHFLDSAQLWPHLPENCQKLIDLGSGAGFPGMVLAIMGVPEVHLIESDLRKAAFLKQVARAVGISVHVHAARLEAVKLPTADVLTARALAPLGDLLRDGQKFVSYCSIGLFPKGQKAAEELTEAKKLWHIEADLIPSITDKTAMLIRVLAPWFQVEAQ